MNYLKMLGIAATAAAAILMAFAATASATWLTSPTGTTYTGTITAVAHDEIELHGTFITVKCNSAHLDGQVVAHGTSNEQTVVIELSTHSVGECNYSVTIKSAGTLEIHPIEDDLSGDVEHTGTVTSSGTEMSISTSVGTCVFTTNNTDIGTLTGSDDTGGHATIDHLSTKLPRTGGNFLCGSSGTLTGGYTITTPTKLWVDQHTF